MELDKIRVAVRPRTTDEAVDLGFVMARHWWRPLVLSWLILALPMAVLFTIICYKAPWISPLAIWWCKPLYEQAPLYLLSRALFAERTPMSSLFKNLGSITTKQMIANLTWRRFSPRRSFNAPVSQLEGLKGDARSNRLKTLHGNNPGGGWLTIICAHLEGVIYFSLFALIAMFIPEEVEFSFLDFIAGETFWPQVVANLLYLIAIAVIAPFYICAGFSLYLSRRIQLEAWDIELDFRQINQRQTSPHKTQTTARNSGVAALLLACSVALFSSADVMAEPLTEQARAKAQIEEILAHEDFGELRTESEWRRIPEEKKDIENNEPPDWIEALRKFFEYFSLVGEVLLWIVVGALLAWVIYKYPHWRHWFTGATPIRSKHRPPEVLFGLDVRPTSLPDNIPDEAWRLVQADEVRAALSLLYRAALINMMTRYDVRFHKSATEGECLKQVQRLRLKEISSYFKDLTLTWQRMAYGHQTPAREQMHDLCERWRMHLDKAPVPESVESA